MFCVCHLVTEEVEKYSMMCQRWGLPEVLVENLMQKTGQRLRE